jgi:hypothetical protein
MMRRISMAARDELVAAVANRYGRGDRSERGRILDEFAAVTGYHRKHAMRLLRSGQVNRRSGPRPDRRVYDQTVREALIVFWEASDRICSKRLRPLLPILVEAGIELTRCRPYRKNDQAWVEQKNGCSAAIWMGKERQSG